MCTEVFAVDVYSAAGMYARRNSAIDRFHDCCLPLQAVLHAALPHQHVEFSVRRASHSVLTDAASVVALAESHIVKRPHAGGVQTQCVRLLLRTRLLHVAQALFDAVHAEHVCAIRRCMLDDVVQMEVHNSGHRPQPGSKELLAELCVGALGHDEEVHGHLLLITLVRMAMVATSVVVVARVAAVTVGCVGRADRQQQGQQQQHQPSPLRVVHAGLCPGGTHSRAAAAAAPHAHTEQSRASLPAIRMRLSALLLSAAD